MKKKKRPPAKAPTSTKKFQGADVIRGKGMNWKKFEELEDRHRLSGFDATRENYVVVHDHQSGHEDLAIFSDKDVALRYARACGYGNVDQRVLTVTAQTLVVATDNDL